MVSIDRSSKTTPASEISASEASNNANNAANSAAGAAGQSGAAGDGSEEEAMDQTTPPSKQVQKGRLRLRCCTSCI